MAILCGWGSIDERGKVSGGKAGDQTGKEVKTGNWYKFGQTDCLRWKNRTYAKSYAKIIKALCNNPHVGYDQSQRTTLYTALQAVGWDYTKLTKDVECDCSALVPCAINCVFKKKVLSSAISTHNLTSAVFASGYFKKMTGSKYFTSDKYLMIGDILNNPGHHVISVLEDGSLSGMKSDTGIVAEPTLRKGSTGSEAKKLQSNLNALKITSANGKALKVDGEFGACTYEAVKAFQTKYKLGVDGIYGPKSYEKMCSLINA